MNVTTLSQLTATIHSNIFVWTIRGVVGKPIVYPFQGRSLVSKRTTVETAPVVIRVQSVARFPIQSNQVVLSFCVATTLDHETEIDRYALIADS
jgi:hypothetical protein